MEAFWALSDIANSVVQAGFNPWTDLIIRPMLNVLMVLYVISLSQMGIAIILFTLLVRLVTLPLTIRQIRQMRSMTTLQPKLREIQTRYARDRSRVSQETMRAYREAGVNPIGCLGPLVVQMPILFGLYRVLVKTLFTTPDDLVGLSEKNLYLLALWLYFFVRSPALRFPLVGLGRVGPADLAHSHIGVRHYLDPTKNDHDAVHRPPTAGQPDHDAVDDAADDSLLLSVLPQRSSPVLDSLQRHRYRHTIFYNWVDASVPAFPQSGAGHGTGSAARGRGAQGDGGTWKCA